ncbi:MAG: histidine kinase [Burkholderiales bacterium]|nr:histidine kinase [Burkholderiales bacterium]
MTASPAPNPPAAATSVLWRQRWQRFAAASLKAFHAYATWLVSISWRRFILLALLLLVVVGILHDLPPFTWTVTEQIEEHVPRVPVPPRPPATTRPSAEPAQPKPPRSPRPPAPATPPRAPEAATPPSQDLPIRIERPRKGEKTEGLDISIGREGIRITPRTSAASAPAAVNAPGATGASGATGATGASGSASAAGTPASPSAASAGGARAGADSAVHITLPPGATSDAVREAVEEARQEIEEAIRAAREDAEQARREAEEAREDAERTLAEVTGTRTRLRKTRFGIGDFLMQFTVLWVLGSALIKATYKGRMQAERQAARATETAESESLKRQVIEARMAAMQAQVEPHFLFNTLASIDHLIETDPARASQMQRNLIALLRASMPTMREAAGGGPGTSNGLRDLGRELAVIRPYLEILKVRMEERLATEIDVPEGLHSAEFPPMMVQTLVENAIKHGLEPKPEGGKLSVRAQIVHGKLQVVVADTGLGFGKAATAGTGVGLANIRERLQLLYGPKASLTVAENSPSGTVVTITVPYKTIAGTEA